MTDAKRNEEAGAKAKILKAAARLFARDGFAGARVDEIAAEAGVNKALLYYHVGNKAQLYEAVLLAWMDVLFAELSRRVSPRTGPEEKLAALAATVEELVRKHPDYPQILVREFSSGGQNLTPRVFQKLLALFEFEGAILVEGRRAGVFRETSPVTLHLLLVVGTVLHLMARRMVERSVKLGLGKPPALPESPSRAVLDLLLDGLRKDGGRRARAAGRPGRKAGRSAARKTGDKEVWR